MLEGHVAQELVEGQGFLRVFEVLDGDLDLAECLLGSVLCVAGEFYGCLAGWQAGVAFALLPII